MKTLTFQELNLGLGASGEFSLQLFRLSLQIEFIGQRIRMSIGFNVRPFNSGRQLALRGTDSRQCQRFLHYAAL
jgi:hypothetical protein